MGGQYSSVFLKCTRLAHLLSFASFFHSPTLEILSTSAMFSHKNSSQNHRGLFPSACYFTFFFLQIFICLWSAQIQLSHQTLLLVHFFKEKVFKVAEKNVAFFNKAQLEVSINEQSNRTCWWEVVGGYGETR